MRCITVPAILLFLMRSSLSKSDDLIDYVDGDLIAPKLCLAGVSVVCTSHLTSQLVLDFLKDTNEHYIDCLSVVEEDTILDCLKIEALDLEVVLEQPAMKRMISWYYVLSLGAHSKASTSVEQSNTASLKQHLKTAEQLAPLLGFFMDPPNLELFNRELMETEEVASATDIAEYIINVRQAVSRKFHPPSDVANDFVCPVKVQLVYPNEVVDVQVLTCTKAGLELERAVEKAVWATRPFPSPPNRATFNRVLEFDFKFVD